MLEFSDVPKSGVVFVEYQQYLSDSGECFGVVITADHSLDSSFIVKLVKAAKEEYHLLRQEGNFSGHLMKIEKNACTGIAV